MQDRQYQIEAVELAIQFDGFCLFMEQRTGKSLPAIRVINARAPERLLIVCPTIAIDVWQKFISEHSPKFGEAKIINFEALWSMRKRLKRWRPDFILCDEAHRIKGRTSKQSRGLRTLAKYAKWKLALTGTPIEKNIWDAWAIYAFIAPEIFGLWSDFKERYLIYGGFKGKKIIDTRNLDEFHSKFDPLYYRVLLGEVSEQTVNDHEVYFDLEESRAAYDSMFNNFTVNLNAGKRLVAPRVITQVLKLHQITGGWLLDENRVPHHMGDEKLARCGALVLRIPKPVVIVVLGLVELYRVAQLMRALGLSVTLISGDHPFVGFDTDVAVIQIRSGVAVDLARAKSCIFYSMNRSFLDFDQARFRIREYGISEVDYYYLLARGTIDEDIYLGMQTKQSVSRIVLDKYRKSPRRIKP